MEIRNAVGKLAALAHEGRLVIFRMLVQAGDAGLPAGEIARRMCTPPNSLSTNLKVLSQAGLIRSRRDGRSIIYAADYCAMTDLLGYLMQDCCVGAPEICAPLVDLLARAACSAKEWSHPTLSLVSGRCHPQDEASG